MKFANRVFPMLSLSLLCGIVLLHAGCASTGYNGGGGGGGQTTVPTTPMGLMAAAGNAQVTLNWTASSGATNYYVKGKHFAWWRPLHADCHAHRGKLHRHGPDKRHEIFLRCLGV